MAQFVKRTRNVIIYQITKILDTNLVYIYKIALFVHFFYFYILSMQKIYAIF